MKMTLRPQASVRYKIQNVDFGTFLEQRGKTDLFLRAHKEKELEGNRRQQWYFVEVPNRKGVYEIRDADDWGVCVTSTMDTVSVSKTSHNKYWRIPKVPGRQTVYLVNATQGIGDENVFLYADGGFSLAVKHDIDDIDDINKIIKSVEYQWKIVEVASASLPNGDGPYYIRSITGYTMFSYGSNNAVNAGVEYNNQPNRRNWEIKSLGNGLCTIKNIHKNSYLCAATASPKYKDEIYVGLGKNDSERTIWKIEPSSTFTHTISCRLVSDPHKSPKGEWFSLSRLYSEDPETTVFSILLKPTATALSRHWCLEPDTLPKQRVNDDDDLSCGIQLGRDYLLRYGGISGHYVQINISNGTVAGNTKDAASVITVERDPEGSDNPDTIAICLSYRLNGRTKYVALNATMDALDLATDPYSWIIEEHAGRSRHYYICDGHQPERVVYGPSASNLAGNAKIITTTLTHKSTLNSLWEFIPA